jgi:hypothetical protein
MVKVWVGVRDCYFCLIFTSRMLSMIKSYSILDCKPAAPVDDITITLIPLGVKTVGVLFDSNWYV